MPSAIVDIKTAMSQTSLPPNQRFRLAPDVLMLLVEDGSSRLLDLGGQFFGLPAVSTKLLKKTLEAGPDRAARDVSAAYGIPPEQVAADLARFLAQMTKCGLLVKDQKRRGLRNFLFGPLAWILVLVLYLVMRLPFFACRVWLLLLLANVSFRIFGWARTVSLWSRVAPASATLTAGEATPQRELINRTVRRLAAGHLLMMECKERALCCWLLLRVGGAPAELIVGVDLFPFLGHCWCASAGEAVGDDLARCERFVPVVHYS